MKKYCIYFMCSHIISLTYVFRSTPYPDFGKKTLFVHSFELRYFSDLSMQFQTIKTQTCVFFLLFFSHFKVLGIIKVGLSDFEFDRVLFHVLSITCNQ